MGEAKNKLAQLAGKLDELVKALAVAGIVGVAFTLGDCYWAVESPTHWFTRFLVTEILVQVPFMAAMTYAMVAWWPSDLLQGYEVSEQASAEEVRPIGAPAE